MGTPLPAVVLREGDDCRAEQSVKTGETVNAKESLMKFFLDTANLNEIREGVSLGLVDGITTNPSLVAKEGGIDFKQHVAAICELVVGDVSAEVTSLETEGMLREGREYAAIAPNVVVKCPLTTDGLRATRQLTSEGIKVNVTLCFSPAQAILAAKAGAAYISPFIGRLDDIGQNGLELVRDIVEIYNNYAWKTEVLAASIRHPIHVIETARAGADVATMPFKVMQQLIKHPLTDKGLDQFLADWRKSVSSKPVQNVNPLKEVVNVRQ
jgi:transaldolase